MNAKFAQARRLPLSAAVRLAALAMAASFSACGGGGGTANPDPGGGGGGGGGGTVNTWRATTLPGQFVVGSPLGARSFVVNLRTAERRDLPDSPQKPDDDRWTTSADGAWLVRWNRADTRTDYPLSFYDASALSSQRSDFVMSTLMGFRTPQLSPDRKRLLTYFGNDVSTPARLTVFDVTDGSTLKRGSQLDGELVTGEPWAWLPDGRYVYMVGAKLMISSPDETTSTLVNTLALPNNNVIPGGGYVSGLSFMAVSPDGRKVAFTWTQSRPNGTMDVHLYVVNIDGTGLRQVTRTSDLSYVLSLKFGPPAWSPDGAWIASPLLMNGTSVQPIFPDEPFLGSRVVGTTGCASNPVYVFPADSSNVPIAWPAIDANYAVKVKAASGTGGEWVTTCAYVKWSS